MKLRCLVVDDEPLARRVLEGYIRDHPRLELAAACKDAMTASVALQSDKIDLLFLDINMPKLDGLAFLRSLEQRPQVILTTAYSEYAVEGFELAVTDYILKPISLGRFLKAVNRVLQGGAMPPLRTPKVEEAPSSATQSIFIKVDHRIVKVALDDLYYLEAYGNYVKLHTTGEMHLTKKSLNEFEEILPSGQFIRVHRSYLVSFDKIQGMEGNCVLIKGVKIPVSRQNKESLLQRMKVN